MAGCSFISILQCGQCPNLTLLSQMGDVCAFAFLDFGGHLLFLQHFFRGVQVILQISKVLARHQDRILQFV
ncbi:hypothetical protein D3C76_1413260 [compost metagenome]